MPDKPSLHIAMVYQTYEALSDEKAFLEKVHTIADWAEALKNHGLQVTVFCRFQKETVLRKAGVDYHFYSDRLPPSLRSYHLPRSFYQRVVKECQKLKIDLIHAHNPMAVGSNWLLGKQAKGFPLLIQDHGSKLTPSPSLFAKTLDLFRRISLRYFNAFVFSAKGQETAWVKRKLASADQCHFVMENASPFKFEQRLTARKRTKIDGNPVFLWVGNLDENKDPLTALKGFVRIWRQYSAARFYMIYQKPMLEPQVSAFIKNEKLEEVVRLVGSVSRDEIAHYYNSCDFLISASHEEGSGYSVIEAMSCGVIPILSDIPSFRVLLLQGEIGALFDVTKPDSLFQSATTLLQKTIVAESEKVLQAYQEHFSFEALCTEMTAVYRKVIAKNRQ